MTIPVIYPLFLPSLGIGELSIIFIIILILFGPGKIPDVCRAMGNGLREFKNASKDLTQSDNEPALSNASNTASEPDVKPS